MAEEVDRASVTSLESYAVFVGLWSHVGSASLIDIWESDKATDYPNPHNWFVERAHMHWLDEVVACCGSLHHCDLMPRSVPARGCAWSGHAG